ncbi:MAG: hypothetical protein GSR77_04450 [Desulfurococcales archaeon]|nr:hypothetical protein [Desulfurococcales archaeon]
MGLAKIIFGYDKSDIEHLEKKLDEYESKISSLKEEIYEYKKYTETSIIKITDKIILLEAKINELDETIQSYDAKYRDALHEIKNTIREIKQELVSLEHKSAHQVAENDADDIADIILSYIEKGVTTPSALIEATGIAKNKVYEILKELVEAGILEKKRDGRYVHYIIASNPVQIKQKAEAEA